MGWTETTAPLLVLEALHGGRDPPAPLDEGRAGEGMHGDHRGRAQQAAELHRVAHLLAGGGDQADRRGLGVDHPDGCLVRDDGGERLGGGVAGDGDHIQAHGAHAGHGLQLIQAQGALGCGGDHALVLADGDEGTGEAADMVGRHHAALFHRVVEHVVFLHKLYKNFLLPEPVNVQLPNYSNMPISIN